MVGKASLVLLRPGWRQQWSSTGAWMRMREKDLVPRAGERAAWEWECCPVLGRGGGAVCQEGGRDTWESGAGSGGREWHRSLGL